jgi:general secretion pathway protein E
VTETELQPMVNAEIVAPPLAGGIRRPPYGFSKRHGVLVGDEVDGRVVLFRRSGARTSAIAEMRRFIGKPLNLTAVTDREFDNLLAQIYDSGSGAARAMMEDLGDDLDLNQLAESLPGNRRLDGGE